MDLRSPWSPGDRRTQHPRFPYRGAGPLLVLATAGILFTTWSVLAPSQRPTRPPDQLVEQPAPTPQPEPAPEKVPEEPPPAAQEADEADACPEGCAIPTPGCDIKGNISADDGERIYHLPGQRWYDETKISPEKGERWFCTEEEAEANGWRRAKV